MHFDGESMVFDGLIEADPNSPNYGKAVKVIIPHNMRSQYERYKKPCDHSHYRFEKHGRICTCGTMITDFGD